ncbi:hypothetical protein [Amycolatopsis sp. NPDC004625]|uniref:hypothetical protein n=1 Tax=Amycolatopsis sp. NPDC004625 TaxID=3154670 RepID=UPI0033B9767A
MQLDKLDEAAKGIRQSIDGQESFKLRNLCGNSDVYGHSGLHDALMDFCVRWSDGLDMLIEDADAISGVLAKSAQAYRANDEAAARSLKIDPGEQVVGDG